MSWDKYILEAIEEFRKLGEVVHRVPSCSHGKPKYCGVYLLKHSKSGRLYVGSHANLYSRPYQHSHLLNRRKHWSAEMQAAYDDDPNFEQFLIVTNDREEAYRFEQLIVDKYFDTGLLFNIGKNVKLPNKGRPVSVMTRVKLSRAGKGRPHSEEHRMRISEANAGHVHSPDTIAKIKEKALVRGINPALTQLAAEKNSVKVSADGVTFPSKKAAANAAGIAESTVTKRILSSNPAFASWKYV
jgi:group I intron endonuclease